MLSVAKLAAVAWDGLDDMLPALHRVYAEPEAAARLRPVLGPAPLLASAGMGLAALGLGLWFDASGPAIPFKEEVNWSALFLAIILASVLRLHLFRRGRRDAEFVLIAASLIPAIALVLIGSALTGQAGGGTLGVSGSEPGPDLAPLRAAVDLLGVAAAMAISVASLCYSKDWPSALMDLGVRLFLFKLMIWVTTLLLIEIGIVGEIVAPVLGRLLSIEIPEWLPDLMDELSWVGLMSVAYLAVIGGLWTVCRDTYGQLLDQGHADILDRLQKLLTGDADETEDDPDDKEDSEVENR